MRDDARHESQGAKAAEISSRKGATRAALTGSASNPASARATATKKIRRESQKANGSSTVSQAYPVPGGCGGFSTTAPEQGGKFGAGSPFNSPTSGPAAPGRKSDCCDFCCA